MLLSRKIFRRLKFTLQMPSLVIFERLGVLYKSSFLNRWNKQNVKLISIKHNKIIISRWAFWWKIKVLRLRLGKFPFHAGISFIWMQSIQHLLLSKRQLARWSCRRLLLVLKKMEKDFAKNSKQCCGQGRGVDSFSLWVIQKLDISIHSKMPVLYANIK